MVTFAFESALPHGYIFLGLAVLFGFYMAWTIGANDVANAMGTSVGSGALTLKKAVIIAAIMELAGAVFVGMHVTDTVRKGIFDPGGFDPTTLVLGFLAALLASAVWLQIATWFGWPVSTTHSIVGAIVGVGVLVGGADIVRWGTVASIVLSWVTSPICGGVIGFLLFRFIQKKIIDTKHPLAQTYKFTPFLVFYVGFVLSLVMVYKGLKNLNLNLNLTAALLVSAAVGIVAYVLTFFWIRKLKERHDREREERNIELTGELDEGIPFQRKDRDEPELRPALVEGSRIPTKRWEHRRHFEYEKVESIFAYLMILSACFLAFAHGANDVANAIGPVAGVFSIVKSGAVAMSSQVPIWILLMGGVGIVVGLATWGYKVIETIGRRITELTPSRGFAANIGAATTIVLASRLGFPISTTHTLVGAVLGIGLARGFAYLNLRIVRDIVISWIITIPAGAGLAVLFFQILKSLLA